MVKCLRRQTISADYVYAFSLVAGDKEQPNIINNLCRDGKLGKGVEMNSKEKRDV
ncbi:MAG: hypothetical protein HFJ27_04955 [Clostridia bacterium]|nr:hypothetical protein [Clostridia bacterium]